MSECDKKANDINAYQRKAIGIVFINYGGEFGHADAGVI
jgi:hypothetical protein